MMTFNEKELRLIFSALTTEIEKGNEANNVIVADAETFKTYIAKKDELIKLVDKVIAELQPINKDDEESIFGIK